MKNIISYRYTLWTWILCIANTVIKLALHPLPPFSDSNVYYNNVITILNNHFNPFTFFIGFKPPFLFELTAVLFRIFGPSYTIGHIITVVASSLILFYIYLLGKELFNPKVGYWASVLFFFLPLFQAQSLLFTDAIIVTPLLLAATYYYFRRNPVAYCISSTLAVLTRETCVFLPLLLASIELFKEIFTHQSLYQIRLNKIIVLLAPLTPFIVWMYINKYVFGWFLEPINVGFFTSHTNIGDRILTNANEVFIQTGSCIFIFFICFMLLLLNLKRIHITDNQRKATYIGLAQFILLFVFYSIGPYHTRYMLSSLPLLCIVATGAIFTIWKSHLSSIVILFTTVLLVLFHLINCVFLPMKNWGESDLTIFQTSALYKKSISTIETNYQSHPLIVTIPWIYPWSDQSFGYSKNGYKHNLYYWNPDIPEEQEYHNMIQFANDNALSPIIFIQQSDDTYQPSMFDNKKLLIDKIYVNFPNTMNYHLLYEIRTNTETYE